MIDWSFLKDYFKYGNIILILLSLFLIFVGSKFLLWVMTIASFFIAWVGCLMLTFNLEWIKDPRIPDDPLSGTSVQNEEADWTMVIVAIAACFIIGVSAAYGLYKLFKKRLTWSLGSFFGYFLFYSFLPNPWNPIGVLVCCLGAIAGGYIGNKLDRTLKTFCTSAIGSVILVEAVTNLILSKHEHSHAIVSSDSGSLDVSTNGNLEDKWWLIYVMFTFIVIFTLGGTKF